VIEHQVRAPDSTRLHVVEAPGDGPLVVLLHGAVVSSSTNFLRLLAKDDSPDAPARRTIWGAVGAARFRTVAIDMRGHGRSSAPPSAASCAGDALARDVMAVVDALGPIDGYHVVGYSFGAITAMRLGQLDGRVRSLVLGGTGPDHIQRPGIAPQPDLGHLARVFLDESWDQHPDLEPYRAMARLDPASDLHAIGTVLLGADHPDVDTVRRITVPTLVLNGGEDDPDDSAAALAAIIPGAVAAVVGTGTHVSACNDPLYCAAVVDFVRTASAWSGSGATD
jgi:pimeloyl-ACP methyl ester carboxylesterase